MANTYNIGDTVYLPSTFAVSGVATDPTTITLTIKEPDGTSTDYTYALSQVTKSATGIYYKNFSPDQVGMHFYCWTGTGTVATAQEDWFMVKPQASE